MRDTKGYCNISNFIALTAKETQMNKYESVSYEKSFFLKILNLKIEFDSICCGRLPVSCERTAFGDGGWDIVEIGRAHV